MVRAKAMPGLRRSRILVLLFSTVAALTMCGRLVDRLERDKTQIAMIQIKELEGALTLFHQDTGRYPTTSEGLSALVENPRTVTTWMGPYVQKARIPIDPWGRPYLYRCPGRHLDYDLFSYGADGMEGGNGKSADITNWEAGMKSPLRSKK